MLRELIRSRVGVHHDRVIDPATDTGELACTIQVGLADEGVVLSQDEVEAVITDARARSLSADELVDTFLAIIDE